MSHPSHAALRTRSADLPQSLAMLVAERAARFVSLHPLLVSVALVAAMTAWPVLAQAQTQTQTAAQPAAQTPGQCTGSSPAMPMTVATTTPKATAAVAATPVRASTSPELTNRLKVGTVLTLDRRTRTVGEAFDYLLTPIRYRMTSRTVNPETMNALMRRPVPPAARDAGLVSIESALLLLVGAEHRIVVDHSNRLVAVERMPLGSQEPTASASTLPRRNVSPLPDTLY
jgi:hypothetical protein